MSKSFTCCLGNSINCFYSYAKLVATLVTCMPVNFVTHAIVAVTTSVVRTIGETEFPRLACTVDKMILPKISL